MTRKASPSVLLHKSEVTYRDTGVSKNCLIAYFVLNHKYFFIIISIRNINDGMTLSR